MHARAAAILVWALVPLPSGCTAELTSTGTGRGNSGLTGGIDAEPGMFPSTVFTTILPGFGSYCTAAKIGPRHLLTAAHCLWSADRGEYLLSPGDRIAVTNRVLVDRGSGIGEVVTVRQVIAHPVYVSEFRAVGDVALEPVPPDVGLIEIEAGLAAIPVAPLAAAPVAPGTGVTLQGYGCEEGLAGPQPGDFVQLKYANTLVAEVETALAPDRVFPYLDQAPNASLAETYFFTLADGADNAALCFGDSGGPVYTEIGGVLHVAGVNAYYSFSLDDPNGVARTNWFTRLNGGSRHDTSGWIAGILEAPRPVTRPEDSTPGPEDCGRPCDTGNPCERGEVVCEGATTRCVAVGPSAGGEVCRPAAGPCDVAELCTGSSTTCPGDSFQPAGILCRPAADTCDAPESCTGTTPTCPSDARDPACGSCPPCAAGETCVDGSCVAACMPSAEVCDGIDQSCDGVVDDGCPSGSTYLSGSGSTSTVGDPAPDGPAFRLTCPSGQVIVGAFGYDDDVSVREIGFYCATPRVREDRSRTPYRYSTDASSVTTVGPVGRHSSTSTPFDFSCGVSGSGDALAMRRVRGYLTPEREWLQYMSLKCNPMDVEGSTGSFRIEANTGLSRSAGMGGLSGAVLAGDTECPPDHFAYEVTGHTASATGRLEDIRFACRRIEPAMR